MSSKDKNLSEYKLENIPDASEMKMGIVVSEWNTNITSALKEGCIETLIKHGMPESNIKIIHVPGTYELTSGASLLGSGEALDGIICLGCVYMLFYVTMLLIVLGLFLFDYMLVLVC